MSTYDDASLIYYPSGYKAGTAYSLKPTDGSGDLTFTRASTATRVNAEGLIETAGVISPTELIVNGDFATDTSWTKIGSTISGGQAIFPANGTNILLFQTASPSISVGSIVKLDYEIISNSLSNGTLRTGGIGSSDISDIINLDSTVGVHSVYITARAGSSSRIMLWLSSTSGTLVIDNVSVKEVIENNVPRIDYTGGGCGKLLLEPQRTNITINSENFTSGYVIGNLSVTANVASSPSGTTTANKLYPLSSGAFRWFYRNTGLNLTGYTMSIFAKADGKQFIWASTGSINDANFDLINGTITFVRAGYTAKIEAYPNGWYRCSMSCTSSPFAAFGFSDIGTTNTVTASGTDGALFWGFQIEQGYTTSYIPTTTTAVTRVADKSTTTGLGSIIGQTEGTIYLEGIAANINADLVGINRSTTNAIFITKSNLNSFRVYVYAGGVNLTFSDPNVNTDFYKLAITYKSGNSYLYVNGVKIGATNTSTFTFSAPLNILELAGNYFVGVNEQKIQGLIIFPTAQSEAAVAALTTL